MNWFVLALAIGVDIYLAVHVDPLPSAHAAPPERRWLDAYDGLPALARYAR